MERCSGGGSKFSLHLSYYRQLTVSEVEGLAQLYRSSTLSLSINSMSDFGDHPDLPQGRPAALLLLGGPFPLDGRTGRAMILLRTLFFHPA